MIAVMHKGESAVLALFSASAVEDAPIEAKAGSVRVGDRWFAGKVLDDFTIRDDLTWDGDLDRPGLIVEEDAIKVSQRVLDEEVQAEQAARTEMAHARHPQVDALRDEKIAEGVTYTMPDDGQDVFVPLADQTYIANVQSLVTQATALAASGDTTTTINIGNATDDGEHELTAAQMIAFGQAIMGHIQAFYAAARARRKELTRIAQDTPALKDVSDALDAYDFTTGWPTEAT